MMSFLGALLLTGVAVIAVYVGILFMSDLFSDRGGGIWIFLMWSAFSVAVTLLPISILMCIAEGEGNVFAKTLYILKGIIEVPKEALADPSVWDHILAFAPMIVGSAVGILCVIGEPGLAPVWSFVAALITFVVAVVVCLIASLIAEISGHFGEIITTIFLIAICVGGGAKVITITVKN